MSGSGADLENIQQWFHASITHPQGVRDGLASDSATRALPVDQLEDIVLPSNALSSMERLSIYANMYFERLIEVLAGEFPSVQHLVGAEVFDAVVNGYVTRYPSTHYSLSQLGSHFPRFLLEAQDLLIPHREFAAAVATVERVMEDVFDEEQVEPLSPDRLQATLPESWYPVRLKIIPALRLLELPFPVNDYINAVRDQRDGDIPTASRSFVVVYRSKFRVWRMDLDERQFTLLSELQAGRTLGEAVGACAALPGSDPQSLADALFEWFRNWAAEGFFHKLELS